MISYKPLWKTLVEKEMKKTDLLDVVGISRGTLTKLSKNEPVSVKIIDGNRSDRCCRVCEVGVNENGQIYSGIQMRTYRHGRALR